MADQTPLKRQREETQIPDEGTKRHKSYNHILSLLEAEDDDPNHDLSSLITALQHELSSNDPLPFPASNTLDADRQNPRAETKKEATNPITDTTEDLSSSLKEDGENRDDKEQVIRHLLEASDDELGIPNREDVFEFEQGFDDSGNGFALCDRLWELEDEAANYYTLLQTELFL
ncbi:F-box/kelch-repeat protein SKIP11-like isoform X1 [Hibiscus syriacus]|uniref:F-box/kelch-repeat protein SKIP11-like isoform X1 n=1 Tax=Hibiscus syriacus TaxID=106335 RepID=A0A6A3ALB5_HIBSY|nr:uncharacterized protein LOC120125016 [Hibiscus syriacus]KAE8705364.1 F-box/kelch-repeat protein SKIP11-like isoform X1 [Hibiscus syriacus]